MLRDTLCARSTPPWLEGARGEVMADDTAPAATATPPTTCLTGAATTPEAAVKLRLTPCAAPSSAALLRPLRPFRCCRELLQHGHTQNKQVPGQSTSTGNGRNVPSSSLPDAWPADQQARRPAGRQAGSVSCRATKGGAAGARTRVTPAWRPAAGAAGVRAAHTAGSPGVGTQTGLGTLQADGRVGRVAGRPGRQAGRSCGPG